MKTYCRLTRHHLFRCQLRKCGLEPEKINWKDPEENARARECIKKLYTSEEWRKSGRRRFNAFRVLDILRQRLRENRQILKQIRKKKQIKKLSWEQIWEILHKQYPKNGSGKIGINTFMTSNAWTHRCRSYKVNRQMILSMTKEELKDHITNVMLEKKLGENWRDILYEAWEKVNYHHTPARRFFINLEISIADVLGKTFEEFVAMIKDKLWEMDRGMPSRWERVKIGIKKKSSSRKRPPKVDNFKELIKVLERTNVRHALLMASRRIYVRIWAFFGSIGGITKEALMDFLLRADANEKQKLIKGKTKLSERCIDSEEELLRLLETEDLQVVLRKASSRLYKNITEYYRRKGLPIAEITKEHVAHYLSLKTAKKNVKKKA